MVIKKAPAQADIKMQNTKIAPPSQSFAEQESTALPRPTSAETRGTVSSMTTEVRASNSEKKSKSRVIIKYDVGFPNNIYIRGKGANLNWDKGTLLKNTGIDEWVWETDLSFTTLEFKVLINDFVFEVNQNHTLRYGESVMYTPIFSS